MLGLPDPFIVTAHRLGSGLQLPAPWVTCPWLGPCGPGRPEPCPPAHWPYPPVQPWSRAIVCTQIRAGLRRFLCSSKCGAQARMWGQEELSLLRAGAGLGASPPPGATCSSFPGAVLPTSACPGGGHPPPPRFPNPLATRQGRPPPLKCPKPGAARSGHPPTKDACSPKPHRGLGTFLSFLNS